MLSVDNKIAVFDLGEVVVDIDTSVYNGLNIFKHCVDEDVMYRFGLPRWEIGFISDEQMITHVARNCNLPRDKVTDIIKSSIVSYNDEMIEFIKTLPYFRFALTNITPLHWDVMAETVEPLFTHVYKSYELRIRKPEVSIYHEMRSQVNIQFNVDIEPEHIYFVDDRMENVDTALSIGWNALHFDGDMNKVKEFFRSF